MNVSVGTRLAHYEITAAIGKGGMGEVWRAKDTKLGRDVAIKVLPEEFTKDAERLARFEREARLLASLDHPGIASIYEIGTGVIPSEQSESRDLQRFLDCAAYGGSARNDNSFSMRRFHKLDCRFPS
jgi:serine/threonine protein kinase